jgi:zinc finger HIT domain-containing protein 1
MFDDEEEGRKYAKGRARQTISDKRSGAEGASAKKKKSTMNIRTAILYKKNLATLLEDSVGLPTCKVDIGGCAHAIVP